MSAPPRYPINRGLLASALDAQFTPSGSVAAQIAAALVPYSTTVQMQAAIDAAIAGTVTMGEVDTAIATALADYSTTTAMNTAISTALVGYSTTTQMNTAISSAITTNNADYSTTTQMNTAISTAVSGFATATTIYTQVTAYDLAGKVPVSVIECELGSGAGGALVAGAFTWRNGALNASTTATTVAAVAGAGSANQLGVYHSGTGQWQFYLNTGLPTVGGVRCVQGVATNYGTGTPMLATAYYSSGTQINMTIYSIAAGSYADPVQNFVVRIPVYAAF